MTSFHDQWMKAWNDTALYPKLRARLVTARVLIDEDNAADVRREGGTIIREVRQQIALREARTV